MTPISIGTLTGLRATMPADDESLKKGELGSTNFFIVKPYFHDHIW